MSSATHVAIDIALKFALALAKRDYTLTTQEYQGNVSLSELLRKFENTVPLDWGPIEVHGPIGEMLDDWPDKQPYDIGWIYFGLWGEIYPYNEGLYILISEEDSSLKVHDVDIGRP
jgi:hypothetical protein